MPDPTAWPEVAAFAAEAAVLVMGVAVTTVIVSEVEAAPSPACAGVKLTAYSAVLSSAAEPAFSV